VIHHLFKAHPESVGETYGQHFLHAHSFGIKMMVAGLACCLHGVFPRVFECTGSNMIKKLYADMITHRQKSTSITCQSLVDHTVD